MISINFSEDCWSFFVVDHKKEGEESVLAVVYNIDVAEEAKSMYEAELKELDFQRVAADKDISADFHSWRDEDCLGGE